MMVRDVAKSYKHMPAWRAYEKGIEALANSVTSINTREAQSHKGLTFGDLLIKVWMCHLNVTQDLAKRQLFSPSSGSANTLFCLATSPSRHPSATARKPTPRSKRSSTGCGRRLVRSTRQRMILGRGLGSPRRGCSKTSSSSMIRSVSCSVKCALRAGILIRCEHRLERLTQWRSGSWVTHSSVVYSTWLGRPRRAFKATLCCVLYSALTSSWRSRISMHLRSM